jgi:hypothetical protein
MDTRITKSATGELTARSPAEEAKDQELLARVTSLLPGLGTHWNQQLILALKRQTLSRILYYSDLYRKIVEVPGVICEFGVQWGATLNLMIGLRAMFEQNNYSRHIYGFDTFRGFANVSREDGGACEAGDFSTGEAHQATLEKILELQEFFARPSDHRNFTLVAGDASQTVGPWLEENPHAVISMAIFDMDVYRPTREVLTAILPRLTKGSLLVFDELNCPHFPGETVALSEVLGLNTLALKRNPNQPYGAWAVFGE